MITPSVRQSRRNLEGNSQWNWELSLVVAQADGFYKYLVHENGV